jgi:hypothetical protein
MGNIKKEKKSGAWELIHGLFPLRQFLHLLKNSLRSLAV